MKKKTKKEVNNLDKYFFLTWKKLWIIVILSFVSIMLHNLWYVIFGFEEAVFFSLVVLIIPTYFIICIFYSLIKIIKNRDKKIFWEEIISILIGIAIATIIVKLGYFRGPWFFGIISLFFAMISYWIIKKVKMRKKQIK
jgi:hypothetical protein